MTQDPVAPALKHSVVRDEWIDSNDHMNSAMYFVACRDCSGLLFRAAGLTPEHVAATGYALVQREAHIRYVRELRRGDPILMRSWVAGIDSRSVHVVTQILHETGGWLSASVELFYTYFDRASRRSSEWDPQIRAGLDAILAAGQATLPPDSVGRRIAVRTE